MKSVSQFQGPTTKDRIRNDNSKGEGRVLERQLRGWIPQVR